MPCRYYCDYCDAYLLRDSPAGRTQHMRGAKHRDKFKEYFHKLYADWAAQNMHLVQAHQLEQQQQMYASMGMQMPSLAPPGGMAMPVGMGAPPGVVGQGAPPGVVGQGAGAPPPSFAAPPRPTFAPPPQFAKPPPSFKAPPPMKKQE